MPLTITTELAAVAARAGSADDPVRVAAQPVNFVVIIAVALAAGVLLGLLTRLLLRDRISLGFSSTTLVGLLGAMVGAVLGRYLGEEELWRTLILTAIGGLIATAGLLLVADRWAARSRPATLTIAELIEQGEHAQVEFKSSARHNKHTGQRDEKLEMVIAKTVAGFANAHGGTLLIGVADDGTVLGLEDDYRLSKSADRDRYELFLRDLLVTTLGAVAAAAVVVSFDSVDGQDVCRLVVAASPRPVFVAVPKSRERQFWVRSGNSTRELAINDALNYCLGHWRPRQLRRS